MADNTEVESEGVLDPELKLYLRCLQRMIYVVTDEEDQFLLDFNQEVKQYEEQTYVYNSAFGLIPLRQLIQDWTKRQHTTSAKALQFLDALTEIYKDEPKPIKDTAGKRAFYIITDPERHLNDPNNVRRLLNIAHQLRNNLSLIKHLIFVGPSKFIPAKLAQYIEVVHYRKLSDDRINTIVQDISARLSRKGNAVQVPDGIAKQFRGMTAHMIEQAVIQSVVRTKKDDDPQQRKRIVPQYILEFRRRQLQKTDFLTYLDPSQTSFDSIGGLQRLKLWAKKVSGAWTEEGEKFGLEVPKGVLVVGVYGCGKSLFVKALGNAWGVPVIVLSMSKLRGGLVGESEGNLRRALQMIESVSPCIVFIDEAEKEFAGSGTSANDAGVASRMVGMLSTWVQDTKAKVCFAMTANTLDGFPPEVLNRLDDRFFVDLPSDTDRIDILKIHLRQYGQDPGKYALAKLAQVAKNLVGREIGQAVKSAMIESFHAKKADLDEKLLSDELTKKPRIVNTMTDEIKKLLDWVGYDPDKDEGIRAKFASNNSVDRFKVVLK